MSDVAVIEALADMGMSTEEIAGEAGCDAAEVRRVLGLEEPSSVVEKTEEAPPKRKRAVPKRAPEPGMAQLVKLDHSLISWSRSDDRIISICESAIDGPGRPAPLTVRGRQVSRAGLTQLLAEEMSMLRLGRKLREAQPREQDTLVGLAALAVRAFEAVEADSLE